MLGHFYFFLALSMVVAFFFQGEIWSLIVDLRKRRANNQLFALLAKEGQLTELIRICRAIGMIKVMDKEAPDEWLISLGCFRGCVIRTIAWRQLAVTIGSILGPATPVSTIRMNRFNQVAEELVPFYRRRCHFLMGKFSEKAGERHPIVVDLQNAFTHAYEKLCTEETQDREYEAKKALNTKVEQLLKRAHGVSREQLAAVPDPNQSSLLA